MAHEHRPDLMLLDINLMSGGMDGISAARAIRADPEIEGTSLVALSADASDANIQEALAAGFDEFLAKPLDIDRLWQLCGSVLDEFSETECRKYFRHCGYRYT